MWAWNHHTTDSRQILITAVETGSPADGVLKAGDVILGVDGRKFTDDARIRFGHAVTEAEKTENKGQLRLVRWRPLDGSRGRKGTTDTVVVPLRVMGSYSDTSPWDCAKSQKIIDAGCRHIAKQLRAGISTHGIANQVNVLALLASGKPEYLPLVRDYAHKLAPPNAMRLRERMVGSGSWLLGHTLVFLAEYHLATGDRQVLPAIRAYAVYIAEGQGGGGLWDHGVAQPFANGNGGKRHGRLSCGYGGINAASLICHLGLVLSKKCGVKHPEVLAAVDKSNRLYGFFVGKGSIPYGDHCPVIRGEFDHNGKTALGALIFDLQNKHQAARFFSRTAMAGHDEREVGHTGNYYSYLWGPLGVNCSGPRAVTAYLKEQRWRYELSRRWDGSFPYLGAPGRKSRDGKCVAPYRNWDCTGEFLLAYALPKRRLYLTGKDVHAENALTAAEVRETIDVGRGFNFWVPRDNRYGHKPTGQLLTLLGHWSPTVRNRAALSLSHKDGDFSARLAAMLKGRDPYARLGACQAIEHIGERAAATLPALRTLLSHHDSWVRVSAVRAISSIPAAAQDKQLVHQLLRMAARRDPNDDPWQREQRWLGYSLFFGATRNYPLRHAGLLHESLDGVDRDVLDPVVRMLLESNESFTRAAVSATVYKNLSYEQIQPLLPTIYKSTVQPATSNTMSMERSQIDGLELLSQHRIAEGIDACVRYIDNGRLWNPQKYDRVLNALVRYGAHAQRVIPQLQAITEHIEERQQLTGFRDKQRVGKLNQVKDAIAAIKASKERPELRPIWREPDNPRPPSHEILPKDPAPTTIPSVPASSAYLTLKGRYDQQAQAEPRPDILFIGDSITARFPSDGAEAWNRLSGGRKVAQIGIAHDRTQWLLWRLQNGNLEGMSPKVVVLMIGTGNLHQGGRKRNSSAETGKGMIAVVDDLRKALPDGRLIVMGLLPRAHPLEDGWARKATTILAEHLRQGGNEKVTFIDPRRQFSAGGRQDRKYFKDSIHLNAQGYSRWAALIEPALTRAFREKPDRVKPSKR